MKQMDEMELQIRDKAIKWSWFFTVLALFAWAIYDFTKSQSMSLPAILLSLQFLLYFFVLNIAKWKVDDDRGKKQIVWYFTGVTFFLIVFGAILYFVLGK